MVHFSLWSAMLGSLAGAARMFRAGDPLFLHGPLHRAGQPTGPPNDSLDASLKTRNPLWGLRDLETVIVAADGSTLARVVQMPANNPWVVLQRNSLQTWPMAVRGTAATHDLLSPTPHKLTLQGIPPAELRTLIQRGFRQSHCMPPLHAAI